MRNVKRVILWGLPPSFCALAQRSGCAGRDFEKLVEAIMIVPNSIIEKGITEAEVGEGVEEAATNAQSQNLGGDETATLELLGIDLDSGNQEVYVAEGGVRVSRDIEDQGTQHDGAPAKNSKRRALHSKCNAREARFLSLYASGKKCRHVVWDLFFHNEQKGARFELNSLHVLIPSQPRSNISRTRPINPYLTLAAVTFAHPNYFLWRKSLSTRFLV
jgi:hypothetical protein